MGMPLPVPLLTIDMLDDFPDDGTRYELLEGMLLVTPAPSNAHQVVAMRLAHTLVTGLGPDAPAQVVGVGAIQRGKHTAPSRHSRLPGGLSPHGPLAGHP